MTRWPALVTCVAVAGLASCSGPSAVGPYTPLSEPTRDPARAQELTRRAAPLVEKNPAEAEKLLREALTADLYHGPAHNNLGVIYLSDGRFYEAANEFEWAQKLLPGHPDPHMNLALTFEMAGRTDRAIAEYSSALEHYPGHLPSVEGLARLQVKAGQRDDRTNDLLKEIALRGETQEWRLWARSVLSKEPPQ